MKKTSVKAGNVLVKKMGPIIMVIGLANISGLNGAPNMPGVGTTIYGIAKNDLQTIQSPGADGVTISTAHVPKPGKGFIAVYNTLETGELKGGNKGGTDGRYKEMNYEGFIPGIRPEVEALLVAMQNTEMIWIVETANGRKLQLGGAIYPAYLSGEMGTGKVGADEVSGYKIMIKSYDVGNKFYTASIPLLPSGVITSGLGSITVSDTNVGFATEAFVSLGGVDIKIGTYTPVTGETDADAAAGLAASIEAGTIGISCSVSGNVIACTFPSDYNGWTLSAVNTSNEFTGQAILIVGAAGAIGNTITAKLAYSGIEIPLGSYAKVSGDDTTAIAAGLAADIEASNGLGFTATNDGNGVIVTVPTGSGTTYDGASLVSVVTGTITEIATSGEKTF